MELVDIGRVLVRQRIGLVVITILALLAGLAATYHISLSPLGLTARVKTTHTAQARLLLDAPQQPPTVDLDSGVADTLGLRAGLIADELATDPVHAEIAKRSGIAAGDLAVLSPASDAPPLPITLAVDAADAARTPSEPYVLAVAADPTIPIVSFSVVAADAGAARRIARAATGSYKAIVASDADSAPPKYQLSVQDLGMIRSITRVDRPSRTIGLAVAIVLFLIMASALVFVAGIRARLTGRRNADGVLGPPESAPYGSLN